MSLASRPMVQAYWLGYVESVDQGGTGIELADVATMPVDVVTIAFYNLFPSNMLTTCFGMSQSHDWQYTQAGVAALHQAGIKVTASIIGTPNPPVGWNDVPDPATFARNAVTLFVDTLGCDGIDIDNEDSDQPGPVFVEVVKELRAALGTSGLLSCVSYVPTRDLPWLEQVGDAFDWVSTMAYWDDYQGQLALWQQYADVLGGAKVLVGVSCCSGDQSTPIDTVAQVAAWETQQGTGNTGGMMLWNASGGTATRTYYDAIRENLTIWTPPPAP
ncbi:MAG TPA: glycosyl hydrolase family 18 protein [Frankiaceae bacterium]|jgi:chitinase|nr:glycosyl hydrolase family 18 protein [Frankiaceae bacterium]